MSIVKIHALSRPAPSIGPLIAGPRTPETPHCKPMSALVLPRMCSGDKSFARAGIVGDQIISPKAKTIWLTQSIKAPAISGNNGEIPTTAQDIDQIIPTAMSALYFDSLLSLRRTAGWNKTIEIVLAA